MGMVEKKESERTIEGEGGRTLNKKGKEEDTKNERKMEMKGNLKTEEVWMMEESETKT